MTVSYGRFLSVDLDKHKTCIKELDKNDVSDFLGGGSIAGKVFIDLKDSEAIVFANGLLTGLPIPTANKTSIVFKSPLTGILGETNFGGRWGAELKKAELDGIIISGKSNKPVYIFIHDDLIEIRDATKFWGLDTFEAHDKLLEVLPKGTQIGLIGPAGEQQVKYASVMFEGEFARAAGRTGGGAVLGKKQIKAIAVKGSVRSKTFGSDELASFVKKYPKILREKTAGFRKMGTTGKVAYRERSGDLPIKNFAEGTWEEGALAITGEVYFDRMHIKHTACFMCPIACAKKIKLDSGESEGDLTTRPEYETVGAFGSNLLVSDPVGVALSNRFCNRYGLDTISAAAAISFLFEAIDRGIVNRKELDISDAEQTWGNQSLILHLLHKITYRSGIGDTLAEGVRLAALKFGKDSMSFAIHVRGLELPMHDPRALTSIGVTYATGNRGASHNESMSHLVDEGVKINGLDLPDYVDPHSSLGKGEIAYKMQNFSAMYDALGLCKFLLTGGVTIENVCKFVEFGSGLKLTSEQLLEAGDRAYTLKRIYNQSLGVCGKTDTLPKRILTEKRGSGDAANNLPDLDLMLKDLYQLRGWDENGMVKVSKAIELKLENYLSKVDIDD